MRMSLNLLLSAVVLACACTAGPEPTAGREVPPTAALEVPPPPDATRPSGESSATAHHTDGKVPEPTIDPVGTTADAPASAPAREVTIPAGTTLSIQLGSTVSSASSAVEDAVHATVRRALVIDGRTVVPAGAAVSGYVSEATRSGRVKGRARIGLRFNALRVGDDRYAIRTAVIAREARGTKKKDAAKIGIGAGAGAVTGAIVGGKKGAAIGTAVGAGGGTAVVLATRGEEVSLPSGTVVTARLSEPVTIRIH